MLPFSFKKPIFALTAGKAIKQTSSSYYEKKSIIIVSDEPDNISILAEFCNIELHSYHPSEDIEELNVDEIDEEMYNKFYSLTEELGLKIL